MRVLRYIAWLLLLGALLHLPLHRAGLGLFDIAPALADDDDGGGDDGGADDGGGDDDGSDDGGDDDDDSGDDDDNAGHASGQTGGFGAGGHDDDDAEHARRARLKGALLPLSVVMRAALRKVPGRVLSVKLRRSGARYYYQFRILDKRNHVRSLRLPASSRTKLKNWRTRR